MPSWVLASAFFGSSRSPSSYHFDRIVELLGLEIGRAELNRRPAFVGSFLMICVSACTRASSSAGGWRSPPAAACCGDDAAGADTCAAGAVRFSFTLARTQPTTTPKTMPATVRTMDSGFMDGDL